MWDYCFYTRFEEFVHKKVRATANKFLPIFAALKLTCQFPSFKCKKQVFLLLCDMDIILEVWVVNSIFFWLTMYATITPGISLKFLV